MHQPIKDHLEWYLRDAQDGAIPPEFYAHLESCTECSKEVSTLTAQKNLLATLRVPETLDPRPGFYARVMNTIENLEEDSIWSAFLEPAFGKQLAYTCAALVLLMATYLISTEPQDHSPAVPGVVISQDRSWSAADEVSPQQRDAVLVNLASYQPRP
jgi:hypothetical protein